MSSRKQSRAAARLAAPRIEIERLELGCGARLLVSPRPGAPICAMQLQVQGAFAADPLERVGTAHLTGALVPEGTRRRTDRDLADALEPRGGSMAGDSGGCSGSIAGAHWEVLADALAEVATEPTYPRPEFLRRKANLLDRLAVDADDPRVQGARLFRGLIYGDHWLGRPERGTVETVEAIERRHLTAFHRRAWVARRATIAVCGDVDPAAVAQRFERNLSDWEPGRPAPPLDDRFPRPKRQVSVFRAPRQQVHLFLGHLGIRRDDPDYAAVAVLDHVLGTGSGFTNRIARRLRDDEGLAYSVHASQHDSAGRLPGMFSAYIGTSPEHVESAVRGMVEEIDRIRREPVAEDELALARDSLIGSFVLAFERARARASHMLFADRMGFDASELEEFPRRVAAVSADDVLRAARRCLRPAELCLAGAGPLTKKRLTLALTEALEAAELD